MSRERLDGRYFSCKALIIFSAQQYYQNMGSQLCPATLVEGQTFSLDLKITPTPKLVLQQGSQLKQLVALKGTLILNGASLSTLHLQRTVSILLVSQLRTNHSSHYKGQFQLPDKTIFKGITVGGIPNGQGQEHHLDGQVYVGMFVNGEKNGLGKCTFSNLEEYEGEFKENMMYGRGTYRFANGDVYVGDFVSNFREGVGQYTPKTPNEHGIEYYQGEYRQNQRDGQGVVKYIKGQVLKGIWKKGLLLRST